MGALATAMDLTIVRLDSSSSMRFITRIAPFAIAAVPTLAFASSTTDFLSEVAGLFYIVVGIVLVASILMMLAGLLAWFRGLGTSGNVYRDRAIKIMQWGVATLFTLVLILGVVEFVQTHTSATLYVIGVAIIILVLWGLANMPEEKKTDDKKPEH